MASRGLISKKVHVLDCNCSTQQKQAGAERFDFCSCKVRVQRGRHHEVVPSSPDLKYNISTVFIAGHPARAFRE